MPAQAAVLAGHPAYRVEPLLGPAARFVLAG
jgi:hypothetical protein